MELKEGVTLRGLMPVMRPVLIEAERIYKALGRAEGVTITEACGGVHSAGSFHYYGAALDIRTHYFTDTQKHAALSDLIRALPGYDVIRHKTHFHIEPGDLLAEKVGLI